VGEGSRLTPLPETRLGASGGAATPGLETAVPPPFAEEQEGRRHSGGLHDQADNTRQLGRGPLSRDVIHITADTETDGVPPPARGQQPPAVCHGTPPFYYPYTRLPLNFFTPWLPPQISRGKEQYLFPSAKFLGTKKRHPAPEKRAG